MTITIINQNSWAYCFQFVRLKKFDADKTCSLTCLSFPLLQGLCGGVGVLTT